MPEYGEIRVDYITYTTGTSPNEGQGTVTVSGLINNPTFSGNVIVGNDLTVSGDINASGGTMSGMTGLFTSGTEAAPSISFVDDTDTGFYNAAANEIRITTNGNDRLIVDSDGKVGIGTSSPAAKLDIRGSTGIRPNSVAGWSPDAGTALTILSDTATNNTSTEVIVLGDDRTDQCASLSVRRENNSAQIGLQFSTSFGSGPETRLTIAPTGNVGIGTSDPAGTLNVLGTGAAPSLTYDTDNLVNIDQGGIQLAIGVDSASPFGAYLQGRDSNNNARSILLNPVNGNVGIGTTSPSSLLHLAANAPYITFEDKDNNQDWLLQATAWFALRNQTAASELLRVTADGNVGIGTSDPQQLLELSTNNPRLRITDADTVAASGPTNFIEFYGSDARVGLLGTDNDGVYLRSDSAGPNNLIFKTDGNNERVRIDSSGRLLVNTSSSKTISSYSNSLLQVKQDNSSTQAAFSAVAYGSSGTTFPRILLSRANGTEASPTAAVQNTNMGYIQFHGYDGTGFIPSALITAQVDGTPGVNDMPGRLVFSTTADGADSPTERMRIDSQNNILIGQTTTNIPGFGNTTEGAAFAAGGTVLCISRNDGQGTLGLNRNSSNGVLAVFSREGVDVGSIDVTTTSTTYNTSSDYRLKENVVPLTGAADRVNQLQVHRFNFIADPDTTVDGFLAHEAQAVVPECVTGTKDEIDDEGNPVYQGIDQSKIVPLLTAALQEALAKIETLEQRLNDAGL